MKEPARKTLPHVAPTWVRQDEAVFFITINCQRRGKNHLGREVIATPLLDTVRYRHRCGDWWVEIFLLMPDHLHALLRFPSSKDMETIVRAWKHYTATQLGVCWQRDFFDHRLRRDERLREKADYILNNPVRKGLVVRAEEWPYAWIPGEG